MNFRRILSLGFQKPQPRRRQIRRQRPEAAELLEVRTLMTGNVTASVRNGTLFVDGDAADNQVRITQPAAGLFRIKGLEETTINGAESLEIGSVRNATFRLTQGGTDDVEMQGPISLAGNIRTTFGNGDFHIEGSGGPVTIGRDLTVTGGTEGNVALLNEVTVRGSTVIRTGGNAVAAAGLATLPDFEAATFNDSLNIDNPLHPAVPGTVWTYEVEGINDETDEPFTETIVVEVLSETKTIQGVEARVVRDRVYVEGVLIEDTFDWFAQDDNGNVWYLGEDVTNFEYDENGNLIGTDKQGSWEAGIDDSHAGTIIQANPRIGDRYYQEFQPGNVLDQGEVLSLDETWTFPAGTFTGVVRTRDTTQREPFGLDNKLYAPGVGLIGELKYSLDDNEVVAEVRLVSVELNGQPVTELVPPDGFTGTNPGGQRKGGVNFQKTARITAGQSVLLAGADLRGAATLRSGTETFLVDSRLRREVSIHSSESVSMRNVTSENTIQLRGDIDVHVFDSRLRDLRIQFGPGDNHLFVQDSFFGSLTADGGRGDNLFETAGRNRFNRLRLNRF